ncbi:MAG: hypothetical protein ACPG51_00345 [Thiolinea sp.]
MKTITTMSNLFATAGVFVMLQSGQALADVQFRVAYDAATSEYSVYMTPDSVPAPDLALSAQVTLKVPHTTNSNEFAVENIQSDVAGIEWQLHSRVNGPAESPELDYLSFGMMISGGTPPDFSWQPGIEKKVFTFKSPAGCRDGVALLENADAFNQLPNSAGTNPGNQFTNLGWASANNYLGNYGRSVVCPDAANADPKLCNKAERKKARVSQRIEKTKAALRRLEERKLKLQLRLDRLESRQDTLAEFCPA